MTAKKIHRSIESSLEETPREQWATSSKVSYALLNCIRLRGIVRQHLIKRGVMLVNVDDVISEIAVVMQMKMMEKMEKTGDVYYVAYRVSQLVVSNYGKKSINTNHSEEVSLSSLVNADDDESDALERLSSESTIVNQTDENERRIDLDNAKRYFTQKMMAVGWPADIRRERTKMGRPNKKTPTTTTEIEYKRIS